MISTAMIAAAVQSTTRQKGGHQRIRDELPAVLPKILESMARETEHE